MNTISMGIKFLNELEAEASATRKCLERVPERLFDWKPHTKSMTMGRLAHLVADIPEWITQTIEISVIDFVSYKPFFPKTTEELVNFFEENITGAKNALSKVTNEQLQEMFYLKNNGVILFSSSKEETVGSSINHMVHHRGQLTVYMRLNDILIPSIYGPSADEPSF